MRVEGRNLRQFITRVDVNEVHQFLLIYFILSHEQLSGTFLTFVLDGPFLKDPIEEIILATRRPGHLLSLVRSINTELLRGGKIERGLCVTGLHSVPG